VDAPIAVFAAAELDAHDTPRWHPERRERIHAALAGIDEAGLTDAVRYERPRLATLDELAAVHDTEYLTRIEQFCAAGGGDLDQDTSATVGSWDTARRGSGAVLDAIDALRAGTADVAFAANRPPGHHALAARAMGFCLLNHVAVGAASITTQGERVAIVDWDVHHGNGTQALFYDDPDVLYVSTHESPLYPGTGTLDETGGPGAPGSNLNVPVPAGTRGDALREAFDDVIVPTIESFAPDWLLISAGFDAHRRDPLAGLELSSADFADFARRLQPLVASRRVVVVLEGGYDEEALALSTGTTLSALVGGSFRPEPATSGDAGVAAVAEARRLWATT
jgi:acetoin utilization deacetylase AcuC-like enzyme